LGPKHQRAFLWLRGFRDPKASVEKGIAVHKTAAEETLKALAGVLSREQVTRLKQIYLQEMTIFAFLDPDIQKALKLSDEQDDKISTLAADTVANERDAFDHARGGNPERQAKSDMIRNDSRQKAVAILNDDQKKKWQKMIGETVEIKVVRGQVLLQYPQRRGRGRRKGGVDYAWSEAEMSLGRRPAAEEAERDRLLLASIRAQQAQTAAQQALSVMGFAEWVAQSTARSMGAFHIPASAPPPIPVNRGPVYDARGPIGQGVPDREPPNRRVPPPRR